MKKYNTVLIGIGLTLLWLGLLLPTTQYPVNDLYQEMAALLGIGILCVSVAFKCAARAPLIFEYKTNQIQNIRLIFPSVIMLIVFFLVVQIAIGKVVYLQLGLQVLCSLAVAYAAYQVGMAIGGQKDHSEIWKISAIIIAITSFAASCQGLVQFFQINSYSDFIFLAPDSKRIYGNIRQANYLAIFLCVGMWCIASIAKPTGKIAWAIVLIVLTVMAFVTSATVSRAAIGFLAIMICASFLHGKADRNQKYFSVFIAFTTLFFWAAMPTITRFLDIPDLGSSRIGTGVDEEVRTLIYSNAWQLATENPLFGQGMGNYGYAFTHTDIFPKAKIGSINHAHNLTLQLAFEYGWLVAVVVTLALTYWLLIAWRSLLRPESLVMLGMVLMLALSSQIEKPLWQLYFLWPTCMWIGWITADICHIETSSANRDEISIVNHPNGNAKLLSGKRLDLLFAGITFVLFSIYITASYATLRGIYAPAKDTNEFLHERIQASNKSWFFEPQLMSARALAVTSHVRQEDMVTAVLEMEQASKYSMTGSFLLRYASVAALAGYQKHAEALVWHAILCCGDIAKPLRQIATDSQNAELLKLADFAEKPIRTAWPGSIRETPKARAYIEALAVEPNVVNKK